MNPRLAPIVVASLVAAGLAGCVSNTAVPSAPSGADPGGLGRAASNLTRSELSRNRVTLEPDAGAWTATRLSIDQLFGESDTANLTIAYDPADGARPYWGLIVHATAEGEEMTVSIWGAFPNETGATTLSMEGRGAADVDLAFVLGSNRANTTYHLGLTQARGATRSGANGTHGYERLARRPALNVTPDATGVGGAGGSAVVRNTVGGTETLAHGNLELTYDGPTVGPVDVQRTVHVQGAGSIPADGIGGLIAYQGGKAGVGEWSWDVALPPVQAETAGRDLDPDEVSGAIPDLAQEALGVENPVAFASVGVEPGDAALDVERTYTGAARETTVTWGWSTFDPAEVYGWSWTDLTAV